MLREGFNCQSERIIRAYTLSLPQCTAGFPLHLENLEKQGQTWKPWKNRGFWGKNLEKYYKTWKKTQEPQ